VLELELETVVELELLCEDDTEVVDEVLDAVVDWEVEAELLGVPVSWMLVLVLDEDAGELDCETLELVVVKDPATLRLELVDVDERTKEELLEIAAALVPFWI